MSYVLPTGKALCLRTNNADMTSYNNFQWPESGYVAAPDWNPVASCGNGLHGLLWGEGDGDLLNWSSTAKWLVVEIDADEAIDLNGKVKFPHCTIIHVGDRDSATAFIAPFAPPGSKIVGGTATADYGGTATAGDGGTATAGDGGTATAGYGGCISIQWWDGNHYRYKIAAVGEDGLKPNIPYRLNDDGKFMEVENE